MFLSSLLEATDEECIKKTNAYCQPLEKDELISEYKL